jgi:hypothetical protein
MNLFVNGLLFAALVVASTSFPVARAVYVRGMRVARPAAAA